MPYVRQEVQKRTKWGWYIDELGYDINLYVWPPKN